MISKPMIIRGERIEEQLSEQTIAALNQNTQGFQPASQRRQHVVAPIQIKSMVLVPSRGQRDNGNLKVEAKVQSGPNAYDSTIEFDNVIFEDQDRPDNVSFQGPMKQEYHMVPIQLAKNPAKVRCTCLDFYFTFSKWNQSDQSLYGDAPKPYTPKTDRQPRNPTHRPGMCKHLLRVVQELKNERVVR